MRTERIVVIGASAGGVDALKSLASQLPADFPSPILVVVHVGKRPSILPSIIEKAGPLGASHAVHGETLRPAHFYLAPPDHHMIVGDGRIWLSHGPKEHHARPAIDPLFRSTALVYGSRAIGMVLTGWGQDGTTGLQAIKACGGTTLVQDPHEAKCPSMPASALRYGGSERSVRLDEISGVLRGLLAAETPPQRECPANLRHEQDLFIARGDPMEHLKSIGEPSPWVCPECKGGLWAVGDEPPPRFRCHTGHAYTLETLQQSQSEQTDAAVWTAIRGLQEEALILREMARTKYHEGDAVEAAQLEQTSAYVMDHAHRLRGLVEPPANEDGETPRLRARRS